MRKAWQDVENLALWVAGLLHDAGKLKARIPKAQIKHENASAELISKLHLEQVRGFAGIKVRGYEFSDAVTILVKHHHKRQKEKPPEELEELIELLRKADSASATERGPEARFIIYRDDADPELKLGALFSPQYAPLVLPAWIRLFELLPKGDVEEALKKLRKLEEAIGAACRKRGKADEAVVHAAEEFKRWLKERCFFDRKAAILPMRLDSQLFTELRAETLRELATRASRGIYVPYDKLSSGLEGDFALLGSCAPAFGAWGLFVTALNILRRFTLLVPAAVFGAIMPDLPLFAHLITTSSLAVCAKDGGFRVMVIDLSGIQHYIRSFARAGGATAQLRGRSLMLELALRAAVRYALEEFGLWDTHVITCTGGVAELLIPGSIQEDALERLRSTLEAASFEELNGEAFFTTGWSDVHRVEEIQFGLSPLIDPESELRRNAFAEALVEAHCEVDRHKHRKGLQAAPGSIVVDREGGYALGGRVRLCRVCKLCLPEDRVLPQEHYAALFRELFHEDAPEFVCERCLYAQWAGQAARNMKVLVEIYADADPDELRRQLRRMLDDLERALREGKMSIQLSVRLDDRELKLRWGLVPFPYLGCIYLVVSLDMIEQGATSPAVTIEHPRLAPIVLRLVNEGLSLARRLKEAGAKRAKVLVITLNMPERMLPSDGARLRETIEEIRKIFREADIEDVDVGFGFEFMNAYAPLTKVEGAGIRIKTFDQLASLPRRAPTAPETAMPPEGFLLAICKADVDALGSLMMRLAFSPSRYVGMSELLKLFFGGLTQHLAYTGELKLEELEQTFKGRSYKYRDYVYVIYAGGDDFVAVGHWFVLIDYLRKVRERFMDLLGMPLTGDAGQCKPPITPLLTLSAALVADNPAYPVHKLYDDVMEHLDAAKDEGEKISEMTCTKGYVKDRVILLGNALRYTGRDGKPILSLPWHCVEPLLKSALHIYSAMIGGRISHGVVYRLFTLGQELTLREAPPHDEAERLRKCSIVVSYAYLVGRLPDGERKALAEALSPLRRCLEQLTGCKHFLEGGLPDPYNAPIDELAAALTLMKGALCIAWLCKQEGAFA